MSYLRLIPSMEEYAKSFRQLDLLDFKIIKDIYTHGFESSASIAKRIGAPKQTVSYHSRKLARLDLVRFRALIDETKLGLKSSAVLASTSLDQEDISSRAMTCFPLWRYLAVVDGWKHGNYVRYAIPADKQRDFLVFLSELKRRNLVVSFDVFQTSLPNYPLLNLDFYAKRKDFAVFDWDQWLQDLDSFHEAELPEPMGNGKAEVDLYDLIILRCLEINAKTSQRIIADEIARLLRIRKSSKLISLVSRRIRDVIIPEGLVRGYRAYVFPHQDPTNVLLAYQIEFANRSSLKKFVTGLEYLPYNTAYEKLLGRDELFVRFILPAHESSKVWNSLASLAVTGYVKSSRLFFGDLKNRTWDNVEIYQMFKDETWNFSYGIAVEMLDKVTCKN